MVISDRIKGGFFMPDLFGIFIRIGIATILAGFVGLERETSKRPAGLRTHILVSVASALVMMSNIYGFELYNYRASMDPMRLGAQVISGIGFLGAGTIIKEGATVKGLTTAASLWSVACIGLACGLGFYQGAIFATLFVLLALIILNKIEALINKKNAILQISLKSVDKPGQIGKIGNELGKNNITIKNISIESINEYSIIIHLSLKAQKEVEEVSIIEMLKNIEGVTLIEFGY